MNDAIASSPKADHYDKWQAENDMRTIIEADQIRKDPKRMKCVQRAAKEKLGEMKALKGLAGASK